MNSNCSSLTLEQRTSITENDIAVPISPPGELHHCIIMKSYTYTIQQVGYSAYNIIPWGLLVNNISPPLRPQFSVVPNDTTPCIIDNLILSEINIPYDIHTVLIWFDSAVSKLLLDSFIVAGAIICHWAEAMLIHVCKISPVVKHVCTKQSMKMMHDTSRKSATIFY